MHGPDLDAYFRRIAYAGDRSPTLETLRAVHARHAASIAFENLNPLLGWPVKLDLASLEEKLVRGGRGGYCFEQNRLFASVLAALGFKVKGLGARVLWNAPEGTLTARTHMLLHIDLDGGAYLADVGFGGQTLTAPLRLEPGVEQATPHEPCRLIARDDHFVMESKLAGEWKPLYRFDLHEQLLPDYEVTNWYLANHPESRFVRNLVAARPDEGRRHVLLNADFAVHHSDGRTERRTLASVAEVRDALGDVFRVNVPAGPEVEAALRRVLAPRELPCVGESKR